MYAIQVLNSTEGNELKDKDHPVLWEFKDVFPKEVPRLPPKRNIDFSIDIFLGVVPTSRIPHKMSTQKLIEMKVQLN